MESSVSLIALADGDAAAARTCFIDGGAVYDGTTVGPLRALAVSPEKENVPTPSHADSRNSRSEDRIDGGNVSPPPFCDGDIAACDDFREAGARRVRGERATRLPMMSRARLSGRRVDGAGIQCPTNRSTLRFGRARGESTAA